MSAAPPITDELPIALRAFAGLQYVELKEPKSTASKRPKLGASPWTLIFDTETASDAGQSLRFGTYQLREDETLREEGIFYDPEGVTPDELERLRSYAAANELRLLNRDDFADEIFFGIAWQLRASIIGFNLPFDISRIAIAHGSARREMRGGFSFTLSRQKIFPHVCVKHLSQRSAFIRFAAAAQLDSRGQRRRGLKTPVRRGHFIDVKTLAGALLARSFSLSRLSKFLKVEHPKLDFDEFDRPIAEEMIRYAVRDVQTTWECYIALKARLDGLGLPDLVPEKVYSEASIGKASLKAMGILPWQKVQPNVPRQLLAYIMSSYFGGRSEVRIRRKLTQVMLCDFLSMYPTVCTLMGLWRFVIASGMQWRDSTSETREFLDKADLPLLQNQAIWRELTTLVRVLPNTDIFPVRAGYSGEAQSTIGLNYLDSDQGLWFTLADCIASKLVSGKAPEIIEAMTFEPGLPQADLQPIHISGNPNYRVDPLETDFFKRVIELRKAVQALQSQASGPNAEAFGIEQNTLKIMANATSYGVWVEVNVATRSQRVATTVHTSTCDPFSFATDKAEEPGPFFHPLLATLITGAARLMLSIAERLVIDRGLDWAFCDTDSMAIAKPEPLSISDFYERVQSIVGWFEALNPYSFGGSILKSESVNRRIGKTELEPLYCWAVSAKRYALLNLSPDRQPIMRKVSAHGLGHLRPPYDADDPPAHLPEPDDSVLSEGISRWHVDIWHQIVQALLDGHPNLVALDHHPAMRGAAVSRYSATSPQLLNWFRPFNSGRSDRDRVKPFGFLLAFSAKINLLSERLAEGGRSKRNKLSTPKPIATFSTDHRAAERSAFDRETGEPIGPEQLKSYAETLARYHLHPESKFLNGDYIDQGRTERRHVRATAVRHIGKESQDWEMQAVLGFDPDTGPEYGDDFDRERAFAELTALVAEAGQKKVAKALKTTPGKLARMQAETMPRSVADRISGAARLFDRLSSKRDSDLAELKAAVERDGLRATARRLGVDPSNLARKLRLLIRST